MNKPVEVVGAVIIRDGLVLCAQRGLHGRLPRKWEFPGGKVEEGESFQQALEREIQEEFSCRVIVGEELESTMHSYEFGTVTLTTFYCALVDGELKLSDHSQVRWLAPDALTELDWAPADLPAVATLQRSLAS